MATRDDSVRIALAETYLDATLVSPAEALPGVLFIHGWGGSQQQYIARAREIAGLGTICLTFDLRGHARSEPVHAKVSREENLIDVVAAYDYLRALRGVRSDAIAVVGSSYGGYLAGILTEMRAVRWLALRAPALYEDTGWLTPKLQLHKDQDLPAYRNRRVTPQENRALRACAAFRGDVLLIESEHDNVIPHAVTASYKDACTQARSLTYRVIDAADHGLTEPAWQREYTSLLVKWLKEIAIAPSTERKAPTDIALVPESPPQELTQ